MLAVGPGARDENGKIVPLDVKAGDPIMGVIEGKAAPAKKAA